ncbi:MAG TPA: ABC transporter ATP-binding protein [Pyrinomonadaceae bacterium]|nr:ABC transporter ATP-binding protein [Pyrinomonadaceae bacterium]
MKPIAKVENLSKQYQLGNRAAPETTLRDALAGILRAPLDVFSRRNRDERRKFWALRDVSFEVEPGEVVGIIGRNGAGKSTLLKILSRVTKPTGGQIELYGRTNSLLEVGTGFHPELTGRENIFVNGAILGMKRREIERKFDEIVAFAGIDEFLDTAVKHYSSGMYARLAFSVAAHLDSEILIIDEVLSVGDAEFQKKCLGKVGEAACAGRTIFFVSHNMAAVENLCRRGIVLEKGKVTFIGKQTGAISHYLAKADKNLKMDLSGHADRIGSGEVRVTAIEIRDTRGVHLAAAASGQDIDVCFHFETAPGYKKKNVTMSFMVRTYWDVPVFLQHNRLTRDQWKVLPPKGVFVCRIRRLPLPPSNYRLGFSVMYDEEYLDRIDDASELIVTSGDFYGSGEVPPISHGCCLVDAQWRLLDSGSAEIFETEKAETES